MAFVPNLYKFRSHAQYRSFIDFSLLSVLFVKSDIKFNHKNLSEMRKNAHGIGFLPEVILRIRLQYHCSKKNEKQTFPPVYIVKDFFTFLFAYMYFLYVHATASKPAMRDSQ